MITTARQVIDACNEAKGKKLEVKVNWGEVTKVWRQGDTYAFITKNGMTNSFVQKSRKLTIAKFRDSLKNQMNVPPKMVDDAIKKLGED